MEQWFAIRVTYGRELKFKSVLEEEGFETFLPMTLKKTEKNGKKEVLTVPAVSNLCFVKAKKQALREFFYGRGESCPARFIWDKSTREPIVVPDKAMKDFMLVSLSMYEDTVYLNEVSSKLRECQKVRVTEGPFKGVEGKVVRIGKTRRVMVELPGMLAIATTYIPMAHLEKI